MDFSTNILTRKQTAWRSTHALVENAPLYIFWPIRYGTGHQRFFEIAVPYNSYIILCFPRIVENIYKLLRTSMDRYKQTTGYQAGINLFCVPYFINTRYIIFCAYSVIVGLWWFQMFVFIIKYCRRKGISYIMILYCRYFNPIVWGARRARLAADGSLKIGQTQTT